MEEQKAVCPHCSFRTKERSPEEIRELVNRLSRIEGQIRGVRRMIEENAYCADILVQSSAIQAAMSSFSRTLLSNHIKTCVVEDIRAEKDGTVDELLGILQRFWR